MISRNAFGVWRCERAFSPGGRDDGARGGVAAASGILHDQVAALGKLGVDQPPGCVERALGLRVAQTHGSNDFFGSGPQDEFLYVVDGATTFRVGDDIKQISDGGFESDF